MEVNNNKQQIRTANSGVQSSALSTYLARTQLNQQGDKLDISTKAKSDGKFKNLPDKTKVKKLVIAALAATGIILCVTKGKSIIAGLRNKGASGANGSKLQPSTAAAANDGTQVAAPLADSLTPEEKILKQRREQFDKFDTNPVLSRVPKDTELEQTANNILASVNLNPVFNEQQATRTDISSVLDKYVSFNNAADKDKLLDDVTLDSSKKHILNNFLSLIKEDKDKSTFFYKTGSYTLENTLSDMNMSFLTRSQCDDVFKLYKHSSSSFDAWDMDHFVRTAARDLGYTKKAVALEDAVNKSMGSTDSKAFNVMDICTRPAVNRPEIQDVARFFGNLRKGNIGKDGFDYGYGFDFKTSSIFLSHLNKDAIKVIKDTDLQKLNDKNFLPPKQLGKRLNKMSTDQLRELYAYETDLNTYFKFENFANVTNINELDQAKKKELMRKLVESNSDAFKIGHKQIPIIPKNQQEYCALLEKLSKSIGISTKPLTQAQIANFSTGINSIAKSIQGVDLKNAQLELTSMSTAAFVQKAKAAMKQLPAAEQNKVMDYFGFEIKNGVLSGYPININNGDKLNDIKDASTRTVVQALRPIVEEFSSAKNTVKINGATGNVQAFEDDLNKLLDAFPEFRSIIGRVQHGTHDYTLDVHSLEVLQEVCSNPKFNALSDSDKKVLEISALLHDITKKANQRDALHPMESAFDAYYIIQKLGLQESEQVKIYELIKSHNWLDRLNNPKNQPNLQNIAQDIAFDARHTNTFELAKILCESDLKAVKRDGSFFQKHKGSFSTMSAEVDKYIKRIHETQIVLPQTRIPKASQLIGAETKSADGITNKVVYFDDVADLTALGFAPGTTKKNFLALVHALEQEEQIRKFDTFHVIDTDALLSSSYIKGDNYRVFRNQGLILDVAMDDICAGYWRDFGTGYGKCIELLKQDYLFRRPCDGGRKITEIQGAWRRDNTEYRDHISNRIRKKLGMTQDEYVSTLEKIKDCKSITEIEAVDKNFAQGLSDVIEDMKTEQLSLGNRRNNRSYNEMLISRPHIQGTFAYDKPYEKIPLFLRKYAQDNDLPIIIFGKH